MIIVLPILKKNPLREESVTTWKQIDANIVRYSVRIMQGMHEGRETNEEVLHKLPKENRDITAYGVCGHNIVHRQ